jgi:hypothetical protein
VHHEAQVRKHQLAGGIEVVLVVEAARQRLLVLGRQHRDPVHGTDVGVQRAERRRHRQVAGNEGLGGCGLGHMLILAVVGSEC